MPHTETVLKDLPRAKKKRDPFQRVFRTVGRGLRAAGRGLAHRPEFEASGLGVNPDTGEIETQTVTTRGAPLGLTFAADFATAFGAGPQAAQRQQQLRRQGTQDQLQSLLSEGQAQLDAHLANRQLQNESVDLALKIAPRHDFIPGLGVFKRDPVFGTFELALSEADFKNPEKVGGLLTNLLKSLPLDSRGPVGDLVSARMASGDIPGAISIANDARKEAEAKNNFDIQKDKEFKQKKEFLALQQKGQRRAIRLQKGTLPVGASQAEQDIADAFGITSLEEDPKVRRDQLIDRAVSKVINEAILISERLGIDKTASQMLDDFIVNAEKEAKKGLITKARKTKTQLIANFIREHRAEIERRLLEIKFAKQRATPSATDAAIKDALDRQKRLEENKKLER